jgi:predicted regulator of amino acid metabolism with ACT domain
MGAQSLKYLIPPDAQGNIISGAVNARRVKGSILAAEEGWEIQAESLQEKVVVVNRGGTVLVRPIELELYQLNWLRREIEIDRRVVETTGQRILTNETLKKIFLNMRVTPDFSKVADSLGISVITILPKNAQEKGIVGSAVQILHNYNLSIRQIFVTDPTSA